MQFEYHVISPQTNAEEAGLLEATDRDGAIDLLQKKGYIVVSVSVPMQKSVMERQLFSGERHVATRDIVILSRQISTLFKAQVSALHVFELLGEQSEHPTLRNRLAEISDDIRAGAPLSSALARHPDVFSDFYVNMVRAGEESGTLSATFEYLAAHLDRSYELTNRVRNALIYPAIVVVFFFVIMAIMFWFVVPRLGAIIVESGINPPWYTQITLGISNLFVHYGILVVIFTFALGFALWRWIMTDVGRAFVEKISLEMPYFGNLLEKFYLARISDNMHTMLVSGVSMVRGVEVSAAVVGNGIYRAALVETSQDVRNGMTLSAALGKHPEIPSIMTQMVKVGEETGEVGNILETLATFYRREVDTAVDTLIGLIEPALIIMLGVFVGGMVISILLPIYDVTTSM